jgi:transcription elongation factor
MLDLSCTAGTETLGGKYELHDLVQLDANTAGVTVA